MKTFLITAVSVFMYYPTINGVNLNFGECSQQTKSYCEGFADGRERPGDDIYTWNKTYNNCASARGCDGGLPEAPGFHQ